MPFARAPPEVRVGHSVTFSLAEGANLAVNDVIQDKAATSSVPASPISKQSCRKLRRSITRFHHADLEERLQMIEAAEHLLGDLLNAVELDGDAICKILQVAVSLRMAPSSRLQSRVRRFIAALSSDLSDVTT